MAVIFEPMQFSAMQCCNFDVIWNLYCTTWYILWLEAQTGTILACGRHRAIRGKGLLIEQMNEWQVLVEQPLALAGSDCALQLTVRNSSMTPISRDELLGLFPNLPNSRHDRRTTRMCPLPQQITVFCGGVVRSISQPVVLVWTAKMNRVLLLAITPFISTNGGTCFSSPFSCLEQGNNLIRSTLEESSESCQAACKEEKDCRYFTYYTEQVPVQWSYTFADVLDICNLTVLCYTHLIVNWEKELNVLKLGERTKCFQIWFDSSSKLKEIQLFFKIWIHSFFKFNEVQLLLRIWRKSIIFLRKRLIS